MYAITQNSLHSNHKRSWLLLLYKYSSQLDTVLIAPGFLAGPSGLSAGWRSRSKTDSKPDDPWLRLGYLRMGVVQGTGRHTYRTHVIYRVSLRPAGSSGSHCTKWADDNHSLARVIDPTFKKTLYQVLSGRNKYHRAYVPGGRYLSLSHQPAADVESKQTQYSRCQFSTNHRNFFKQLFSEQILESDKPAFLKANFIKSSEHHLRSLHYTLCR